MTIHNLMTSNCHSLVRNKNHSLSILWRHCVSSERCSWYNGIDVLYGLRRPLEGLGDIALIHGFTSSVGVPRTGPTVQVCTRASLPDPRHPAVLQQNWTCDVKEKPCYLQNFQQNFLSSLCILCYPIMYTVPLHIQCIYTNNYLLAILSFLPTFLRTVACHVTRVSLFRMALCYDVNVTIKYFDWLFSHGLKPVAAACGSISSFTVKGYIGSVWFSPVPRLQCQPWEQEGNSVI